MSGDRGGVEWGGKDTTSVPTLLTDRQLRHLALSKRHLTDIENHVGTERAGASGLSDLLDALDGVIAHLEPNMARYDLATRRIH